MTFNRVRSVILFASLAMAYAIASPAAQAKDQYHFKLIPQDGQELTWTRGVASIDNPASTSMVRLIDSRDKLPDDQTTFRVTILNTGDEPVEVASESIWIEDSAGNRVAMLSHEELEGRHRRDIKRRQALAALGGALSAGSANGYTSGSFNYSGTTSNGRFFNGFGTYSAYDPNLAMQQKQQAAAQNQATFNAIQVRQLGGVEALNGMLRQTTLQPGEITSGIVAFDPPRNLRKKADSESVTVVVRIGATDHRFQAMLIELP
ncbi:hypothetical protein [Novosphingobium sp.]|uniref:hypothetical protein n=1 Tax=Novosphingobium sp. TaxID=1874826 RepID=UPI00261E5117|nr:hypothetical protein [Novosphingobium sp.]